MKQRIQHPFFQGIIIFLVILGSKLRLQEIGFEIVLQIIMTQMFMTTANPNIQLAIAIIIAYVLQAVFGDTDSIEMTAVAIVGCLTQLLAQRRIMLSKKIHE